MLRRHFHSFPGSLLYASTRWKNPGRSWSRATQILGGKLALISGRGGRGECVSCLKMLRLKIHELMCFCIDRCIEEIGYTHHCNDLAYIEYIITCIIFQRPFFVESRSHALYSRRWLRHAEEVSKYIWIESSLALLAKLFCRGSST